MKVLLESLTSLFQFSGAVSLCDQRLGIEQENEPRSKISALKRDLQTAASVIDKAKESLSRQVGSRIFLKVRKGMPAQGELKEVTATGITLEDKSATRAIPFSEFAQEEYIRLVEQTGSKRQDTYIALGTFFLLAYNDFASAQKMLEKAKGSTTLEGAQADLSQLEQKVQLALLKEKFEKANRLLGDKKYFEAAKAFSLILSEFSQSECLKQFKEQIEQKTKLALSESGILSVFKGNVWVVAGKFTVSYDFSDAKQLEDFTDYIWSEKMGKRENQWTVSDAALIGRGAEGMLWKGVIKGDITLELTAKPTSPQEACFYLRICDDGKAAEGRSYSFGFGFKQPIYGRQPPGRGRRMAPSPPTPEIVGYEPQENLIMKLKDGQATYLAAKIPQPTIRAGETYKIRVLREGDRLRSFANDSPVADAKDSDFTKGAVSLRVANSEVRFDDIKITGEFEPTWLSKAITESRKK